MEVSEQLLGLSMEFAVRAAGVVLLLFIAWTASVWVGRAVQRGSERAKLDLTVARFLAKLARWTVLALSLLACLSVFGIQTTSFAAVIGAAGIAAGLAFQGTLSNFASGVMLLVFRPYKVGDVIAAAGVTGTVYELDLFSTTLDTADNRRIFVPNGSIFGSTIENVTYHPTRRVEIIVGVDYGADADRVRTALTEAAAEIEGGLDTPPRQVAADKLGASSVEWAVRVWCKTEEYWTVRERAILSIKRHLEAAGIAIPYSQMDVHLVREG